MMLQHCLVLVELWENSHYLKVKTCTESAEVLVGLLDNTENVLDCHKKSRDQHNTADDERNVRVSFKMTTRSAPRLSQFFHHFLSNQRRHESNTETKNSVVFQQKPEDGECRCCCE